MLGVRTQYYDNRTCMQTGKILHLAQQTDVMYTRVTHMHAG